MQIQSYEKGNLTITQTVDGAVSNSNVVILDSAINVHIGQLVTGTGISGTVKVFAVPDDPTGSEVVNRTIYLDSNRTIGDNVILSFANVMSDVTLGEEEERMWDVFDYIKNNVKDILIPDLEVISHIKPSKSLLKTEKGFINFLWKYPVFPKRNKEEIQFSQEALYWYKDFYELLLGESCTTGWYMDVFTSPLGGIRIEDVKKWRYRKLKGETHSLWESSDYFENVYSFFEESIYCFDGWFEDFDYDFTDEGIDFKWSYPPYFSIFDEGLKHFSQRLWEYFLVERVEMTVKKEWQIVIQGHAAANSIPVIASNRTGIETNEGSATKTAAYEEGVGLYSLSKQAVENHLSGITEVIRRLRLRIDEIKAKPERELKEKFEKEQKEKGKERRKRIDTQAEEFKSNQDELF